MSAGQPDTTFNGTGSLNVSSIGPAGFVVDSIDDGGKRLVLTALPSAQPNDPNYSYNAGFAVTRYLANGALDTSYGNAGRFVFNLGSGVIPTALLNPSDLSGPLVACTAITPLTGSTGFHQSGDLMLVHLTPGGSLDSTYNGAGYKRYDPDSAGGDDRLQSAVLDASNRIVLSFTYTPDGGSPQTAFLRVFSSGSQDSTFVGDAHPLSSGAFFLDPSVNFVPSNNQLGATVTTDGGYVFGGSDGMQSTGEVLKLDSTGHIATSFGTSGIFFTFVSGADASFARVVIPAPGGKLYVGTLGDAPDEILISRISETAGTLDGGFNSTGVVTLGFAGYVYDDLTLAVDSTNSNRVVLWATRTNPGSEFVATIAYTSAGINDTAYGGGGILGDPLPNGKRGIVTPIIVRGGNPAVSSYTVAVATNDIYDGDLIQRLPSGAYDSSFGGNASGFSGGFAPLGRFASSSNVTSRGVAAAPDGSVFTADLVSDYSSGDSILISLFDRNGTLINSSQVAGFSSLTIGGVVRIPSGKFLVAAAGLRGSSADPIIYFLAFNADGTPDNSYNMGFSNIRSAIPAGQDVGYTVDAFVMYPDAGKILVAGQFNSSQRYVARFNIGGTSDTSFGTLGITTFSDAALSRNYALALDSNGRIYAGGYRQLSSPSDPRNGTLDVLDPSGMPLFSTVINAPGGSETVVRSLLISPNEFRVYIGGSTYNYSQANSGAYFLSARDITSLAVAGSYGSGGYYVSPFGSPVAGLSALTFDPAAASPMVIGVGTLNSRPVVDRFNSSGTRDASYGAAFTTDPTQIAGLEVVTIDPNNRPVVAGFQGNMLGPVRTGTVTRLEQTGNFPGGPILSSITAPAPAPSSGVGFISVTFTAQGGKTIDTTSVTSPFSVQRPDGSIEVLTVFSATPSPDGRTVTALYAYHPVGSTFASSPRGSYTVLFRAGILKDSLNGTAIATDTPVYTITPSQPLLTGPGNPDRSFAFTGNVSTSVDTTSGQGIQVLDRGGDYQWALTQLPPSNVTGQPGGFALTRIVNGQQVDTTFGRAGRFLFNLGQGVVAAKMIDAGPGKGFYVIGTEYTPYSGGIVGTASDIIVVKVNETGQLDTTFNFGKGYAIYDLGGSQTVDQALSAGADSSGRITIAGRVASAGAVSFNNSQAVFFRILPSGTPDSSFTGPGGTVIGPGAFTNIIPSGVAYPNALAVLPDGSFAMGVSISAAGAGIIRYNSNGTILSSYGANGNGIAAFSTTPAGPSIRDLVANSTGFYLAVTTGPGGTTAGGELYVAKFTAASNGNLDPSYAGSGRFTFGAANGPSTVAFQNAAIDVRDDGSVVTSSPVLDNNDDFGDFFTGTKYVQVALRPDGTPDSNFNSGRFYSSNSQVTTSGIPLPAALHISSNGRTYVLTNNSGPFDSNSPFYYTSALIYYTPNQPSPGFQGFVLDPIPGGGTTQGIATATLLDGSSATLVVSSIPSVGDVFGLRAFDRQGNATNLTLTPGIRFRNISSTASLLALPSGKYLAVFSAVDGDAIFPGKQVILARYNADGTIDGSFGSSGYLDATPMNNTPSEALAATLAPDGNVLVVGRINPSLSDAFIAKYNASTGALVTSFGNSGFFQITTGSPTALTAVDVERTGANVGRIYATSQADVSPTSTTNLIFRFTAAGQPDTTFNGSGFAPLTIPSNAQVFPRALVVSPSASRIFIGGTAVNAGLQNAFLTAYNFTSARDLSFGTSGVVISTSNSDSSGVHALAIDLSTGTPALIAAGDEAAQPFLRRYSFTGVRDNSYAPSFVAPPNSSGVINAIALDPASRVLTAGSGIFVPNASSDVPTAAIAGRFRQTPSINPVVTAVSTTPLPIYGDPTGFFSVTYQAGPGLIIDPTTFPGSVRVTRPGGSNISAAVSSFSSPDGGRTVTVSYSYTSSRTFFDNLTNGQYTLTLIGGTIADDQGLVVSAADTTLATFNLNLSIAAPTADPDPTFNGGIPTTVSTDAAPGFLNDVLRPGDGFTYVLSTLPGHSVGDIFPAPGGGIVVTRLNANGTLNASYGQGGYASFSSYLGAQGTKLVADGSGGLYVLGTLYKPTYTNDGPGFQGDFLAIHLTSTGFVNIGSPFANGVGYVTYDLRGDQSDDQLSGGFLDTSSGQLVLGGISYPAGSSTGETALIRLALSGAPDPSFGPATNRLPSGAFVIPATSLFTPVFNSTTAFARAADGSFYLAGTYQFKRPAVARFLANGNPDITFGGSTGFPGLEAYTVAGTNTVFGSGVVIGGLGGVFLSSYSPAVSDIFIDKILPSGIVDGSWANSGIFSYSASVAAYPWATSSISARSDDSLIVAGVETSNIRLIKVTPGGTYLPSSETVFGFINNFAGTLALDSFDPVHPLFGVAVKLSTAAYPAPTKLYQINYATFSLDTTFAGTGIDTLATIPNFSAATTVAQYVDPADNSSLSIYLTTDANGNEALGSYKLSPVGALMGGSVAGATLFTDINIAGIFKRPDGRYTAYGSAIPMAGSVPVPIVAVFNSLGNLDTTFGTNGFKTSTALAGATTPVTVNAAALSPAGDSVYIAGDIDSGRFIARYTLDGDLDTTVGGGTGFISIGNLSDAGTYTAIAVDATNSKIYAAALRFPSSGPTTGSLERFSLTLAPDNTFSPSTSGIVTFAPVATSDTRPRSIALDLAHHTIYIGGTSEDTFFNQKWFVFGYDLNTFAPSTTFGASTNGSVTAPTFSFASSANGLALLPDGSLVVAGVDANRPFVTRLLLDGSRDSGFAQGAIRPPNILGEFRGVSLDSLNRPLLFGSQTYQLGNPYPAITIRLNANATIPPTALAAPVVPPLFGALSGTFAVTFTAAPGQQLNLSTLTGAFRVTKPNGVNETAAIVSTNSTDGNHTVTVVYSYTPIAGSGTFGPADAGIYAITYIGSVADTTGTTYAGSPTALFPSPITLSFAPPTVSLLPAFTAPAFGDRSVNFFLRVTPAAGRTLDTSSFAAGLKAQLVNGANSANYGTLILNSATPTSGQPGSYDLSYTLLADSSNFGFPDNGTIQIVKSATPIKDDLNVPLAPTISLLTLNFAAPTAVISSFDTPTFGAPSVDFTVTYIAAAGRTLNLSSLATVPFLAFLNGVPFGSVSYISQSSTDPTTATVRFRLTPPNGAFDFTSNGTLTIAAPELAANGSFESPVLPYATSSTIPANSTTLTGWTTVGALTLNGNNLTPASAGKQSLTLDLTTQSSLFQDIATVPGRIYRLTFSTAPNPFSAVLSHPIPPGSLSLAFGTLTDTITEPGPGSPGYTPHTYYFTATAATTRLQFTAASGSILLDNVHVVTVTSVTDTAPQAVTDDQGTPIDTNVGTVATKAINFVTPTVTPVIPSTPKQTDSSFLFTITYTPGAGRTIKPESLLPANISVIGPNGPLTATLFGAVAGAGNSTIATYRLTLPTGTFVSNQGNYTFATGTALVTDDLAVPIAPASLGTLSISYTAPSILLSTPPTPPQFGANAFTFSVTYTPAAGRTIDFTTTRPGNILALGPNNTPLIVSVVGTTTGPNNSLTVNYSASPTSGQTFGSLGPATYTLAIGPSPVTDSLATPVLPVSLASFSTGYAPVSLALTLPAVPLQTSTTLSFVVTYTASPGRTINTSSLNANNLSILLPNGTRLGATPTFPTSTDQTLAVTYTLTLPSTFGNAPGTYEIDLGSTPATDDLGDPATAANPALGSLNIQYSAPSASFVVPPVPTFADTALTFTVTFLSGVGRTLASSQFNGDEITVSRPDGSLISANFLSLSAPTTTTDGQQQYTATYSLPLLQPPQSGTYAFTLNANSIINDLAAPIAAANLGSFTVTFASPSATFTAPPPPTFSDAAIPFTVTFTSGAGHTIDPAQFNGDEIAVTLPNGSVVNATLLSLSAPTTTADGQQQYTASYSVPITPGTPGTYSFAVNPNSLLNDQLAPVPAGPLGSISTTFPIPSVAAASPGAPATGATSQNFTVVYTADPATTIDQSTVGDNDIAITLPNGTIQFARFVSASTSNPNTLTVVYSLTSASGVFNAGAEGTYSAALVASTVKDARGVPVPAAALFSFTFGTTNPTVGPPGTITAVIAPTGTLVPASIIFPSVTVTNPSTTLPTSKFFVRFQILVGTQQLTLGDVAVSPLGVGTTTTVFAPSGLSLPDILLAPPGSYTLSAYIIDATGNPVPNSAVNAPTQITLATPPPIVVGTLDPTFGGGTGVVDSVITGPSFTLVGSVGIPGTSKILSGGYTSDGNFALVRFNPDGSLDTTLAPNNFGLLTFDGFGGSDIFSTSTDFASVFTTDAQGRLLLGGTSTSAAGDTTFAVLRFTLDPTGTPSLDPTFGTNGIRLFSPPGGHPSVLRSITIDKFGRPYLLGSVQVADADNVLQPQGLVVRLTPNGLTDTTFGALGVVSAANLGAPPVLPFNDGISELTTLSLQNNRIILGGYSGTTDRTASRFLIAALNANGALDKSFATKGVFTTTLGNTLDRVTTTLETAKGLLYVGGSRGIPSGTTAGATSTTALIFRLNAKGAIDKAFNKGAILPLTTNTTFGTVSSLLASANDTILITVATANSLADAAAGKVGTVAFRLTNKGANDPFFNSGSPLVIFDVGFAPAAAPSAALQSDFDTFVQSKQGATTLVSGGAVRSLASRPADDAGNGTAVSVAQLTRDGPDLNPTLSAKFPATVKPNYKGKVTLTLTNAGSLQAKGSFSATLILTPTSNGSPSGDPTNLIPKTLSTKLSPGGRSNSTLPLTLPPGLSGTYTITLSLGGYTGFTDVNVSNDTTTLLGTLTISAPPAAQSAGLASFPPTSPPPTPAPFPTLPTSPSITRRLFSTNDILA